MSSHAHSKKRRVSRTFLFVLLLIVTVLLGVVGVILQEDRPRPMLTVHFTGRTSPGIHVHPFGEFVITNIGNCAVFWWRGDVEAPTDTNLWFSAGLDSNMPRGSLAPGAATNFPAIVPNPKGAPFRIYLGYQVEPGRLDRIHQTLVRAMPLINQVWARTNRWQTVTSQWFYTTADYTNGVSSPEELR